MKLKKYENSKVDMSGLSEEHIGIFLQTMADIMTEIYAPNIEVKVKVKEK